MIRNILVTGANGFIGKNLSESLADSYNLLTPRSFELDLTNQNAVEEYFIKHQIDFIIHCSAVGGVKGLQDKDTTIEENVAMVENILQYKKGNCRIILFGSGAMYGKSRILHKVKENEIGKFIPKDLYGKSKLEIAKICNKREDILCLNIFACYGKYEKANRFPSYAISQNLQNQSIVINQNVVFDYLFIEDLQKIVRHFIENIPKKHKVINITPTQSISLLEIAEIVNTLSLYKSEIIIKNPIMNNEYSGDNSRLLNEIPDFKFINYRDGLEKLYEYLKINLTKELMKA